MITSISHYVPGGFKTLKNIKENMEETRIKQKVKKLFIQPVYNRQINKRLCFMDRMTAKQKKFFEIF